MRAGTIVFLLCGIWAIAPAKADAPAVGHYETNSGPVTLFQDVGGDYVGIYRYKGLPAHIFFRAGERGSYDAIWVQGASEVRCRKKEVGSPYWGRARFTFEQDRMLGVWNYCDRPFNKKKEFRWTGRLKRSAKVPTDAVPVKPGSGSGSPGARPPR